MKPFEIHSCTAVEVSSNKLMKKKCGYCCLFVFIVMSIYTIIPVLWFRDVHISFDSKSKLFFNENHVMDMNVSLMITNPNMYNIEIGDICLHVYDFNNLEVGVCIYDEYINIQRHKQMIIPLIFLIHTTMLEIMAINYDCTSQETKTRMMVNGTYSMKWSRKTVRRYINDLEEDIYCENPSRQIEMF